MEKKYEFTGETAEFKGVTLHRIRALRDFGDVKKGDLGGFIEHEDNLSHEGNCWVGGSYIPCATGYVYGNAKIYENAKVYGNARVYDNAEVFGNTYIMGPARIYNNVKIYDNAIISGCFVGNVEIFGDAKVYENARIYDEVKISQNAEVCGLANIRGNTRIPQDIKI
ncbi:hypothetical protein [Bartonella phoceensis]|uniref:hypothetical protein n=1 Tax=Bartonella phoceensis TaxID=270249 RepID=UPI001ABB864A|nr:hypothetical protein [Bartonella phoceensis]